TVRAGHSFQRSADGVASYELADGLQSRWPAQRDAAYSEAHAGNVAHAEGRSALGSRWSPGHDGQDAGKRLRSSSSVISRRRCRAVEAQPVPKLCDPALFSKSFESSSFQGDNTAGKMGLIGVAAVLGCERSGYRPTA